MDSNYKIINPSLLSYGPLPNNIIGWITELCNTLITLISQYIQLLSHLIDRLTTYPNNVLFVVGVFITLYFVLGQKKIKTNNRINFNKI
jgi:ABC-type proline/glycine betaine transport system permease subunit